MNPALDCREQMQTELLGRPAAGAALSDPLRPLLASLLQAAWGTSPGKHLLNLRIVDRHGQPLRRWRLGLRMAAQMLPLWVFGIVQVLEHFWPDYLDPWVQVAAIWLIASDILVALVNPRGRSLHDLFFATRVVYDFKELEFPGTPQK